MTATEERLVAALAARAERVQPENLREHTVALRADRSHRLQRGWAVGLAAAAAVAAVGAAPFLLDGDGDDAPSPAPDPGPTYPSPPDVGAGWPVLERSRADLDGDGAPDRVRLRIELGVSQLQGRLRIDAELSGDGATYGIVEMAGTAVNIVGPVAADADPGAELVLNRDPADGRTSDWVVLDLVDGHLVELERSEEAPLETGEVPHRVDDNGRERVFEHHRWIGDDGALYSARSVDSFVTHGMSTERPTIYAVDVWTWQVDDGVLHPVTQGRQCVLQGVDLPRACPENTPVGVPALFPERTDRIGVGESFDVDVDLDGRPDTVELDGTVGPGGSVEAGAVELVVVTGSGEEARLPLPGGWAPEVYATVAQVGMVDGVSLLVAQEGGDTTTLSYVATGPEGFSGPLEILATSGAPFGSGRFDDGTPYRTWLGGDNRIYTTVGPHVDKDPPTDPSEVFVWALEGDALTAVQLDDLCVDHGTGRVTRCG